MKSGASSQEPCNTSECFLSLSAANRGWTWVAELLEGLGQPSSGRGPCHVLVLNQEQKNWASAVGSLLRGVSGTGVLPDTADDEVVFTQFMGSFSVPRRLSERSGHGRISQAPGSVAIDQSIAGVLRSLRTHQIALNWRARSTRMAACQSRAEAMESARELASRLDQLSDWSEFDIFRVNKLSHSMPLQSVGMQVFKSMHLIDKLSLPEAKLRSFLADVEAHYPATNQYHNSIHVADVLQGVVSVLSSDNISAQLTDLEILSLLLAACIHDVNHPGVNNSFLVQVGSDAALLYNDTSVNENGHISMGFRLLMKPENNFMEGLSDVDYRSVRRLVIELVLGTDMAFHQGLLQTFMTSASILGADMSAWKDDNRVLLLKFLLHAVDISNPARSWPHCLMWANWVTEELFCQGDRERKAGLPVSPLNDRETTHPVKNQQVFCDHFVKPTFQALALVVPTVANDALEKCASNSSRYARMLDEGWTQLPKSAAE